MKSKTRVLVWDVPTRLFHRTYAGAFVAAALLAFTTDDDGNWFPWHAVMGLVMTGLLVFRIVWGFAGTRYARFRSFLFSPRSLLNYMADVAARRSGRHTGHNPGSAWAIFAMLALPGGLALTGVLMSQGLEWAKEVHEVLAWLMVTAVGLHVCGVTLHTLVHRENITAAMIHGKKEAPETDAIQSRCLIAGVLFLAMALAWVTALVRNFDAGSRTVTIPGTSFKLLAGERPDSESKRHAHDDD